MDNALTLTERIVGKAARALYESLNADDHDWDAEPHDTKAGYYDLARAAVAAASDGLASNADRHSASLRPADLRRLAETAPREPEDAASPGPAHPDGTSEAHFHARPQSAGEFESTASREPEDHDCRRGVCPDCEGDR